MIDPHAARAWSRLLWVGRFEGATLLLLIGVAVPLKHLLGHPEVSRVLGPVHGVVFLAYLWCVLEVAAAGIDDPDGRPVPLWLLLIGGILPFGTWILDRRIRRALVSRQSAEARTPFAGGR